MDIKKLSIKAAEYRMFDKTYWKGGKVYKIPNDLWIYQEIISKTKPDVIIECGTQYGHSARFFADICELIGHGEVITIDIKRSCRMEHPRVKHIIGDSVSTETVKEVKSLISDKSSVMVSLDSDHHADHVFKEMSIYGKWVTPGHYMVVEDTLCGIKQYRSERGPGPKVAIDRFFKTDLGKEFEIDKSCERFWISMFPGGWLRRKGGN